MVLLPIIVLEIMIDLIFVWLQRNLKIMVNMGLSAKQEKDNRVQHIKKEVAEMIKLRIPVMKSKVCLCNIMLVFFFYQECMLSLLEFGGFKPSCEVVIVP